jgi:Leucine-rich repeat (LRR) protein
MTMRKTQGKAGSSSMKRTVLIICGALFVTAAVMMALLYFAMEDAEPAHTVHPWEAMFDHSGTGLTNEFLDLLIDAGAIKPDTQIISLSNNALWNINSLSVFTKVVELHIDLNHITDLNAAQHMPNLTRISANRNNIYDLNGLRSLRNLSNLSMWSNSIDDIEPLSGLTALTALDLYDNRITDITPLANLFNLRSLGLSNNQIEDVTALHGLKDLAFIDLRDNPIPPAAIEALKAALPDTSIFY